MKTFLTLAFATMLGSLAVPNSAGALDLFHSRSHQVDSRMSNEQRRIDNGVATGRLSPGQANRLERSQQHIQQQESRDRAMNNGHLTWRERLHLNRKENVQSHRINQAEHHSIFHNWFGSR